MARDEIKADSPAGEAGPNWERWRGKLQEAWRNDWRATMTCLLEEGPMTEAPAVSEEPTDGPNALAMECATALYEYFAGEARGGGKWSIEVIASMIKPYLPGRASEGGTGDGQILSEAETELIMRGLVTLMVTSQVGTEAHESSRTLLHKITVNRAGRSAGGSK